MGLGSASEVLSKTLEPPSFASIESSLSVLEVGEANTTPCPYQFLNDMALNVVCVSIGGWSYYQIIRVVERAADRLGKAPIAAPSRAKAREAPSDGMLFELPRSYMHHRSLPQS